MTLTTRRAHTSFNAQVLILLGAYLFGGGGGDDPMALTERVQEIVQDDGRRAIAGDYARQIQETVTAMSDDVLQIRNRILEEMRESKMDAPDLRADIKSALAGTLDAEGKVVDLRFKMKEQMTRGEWTRLFNELRALQ
jgi:DUF917 family protein